MLLRKTWFGVAVAVVGWLALAGCTPDAPLPEDSAARASGDAPAVNPQDFLRNFNQYLAFDAIQPVYDPVFAAADQAPYADQELVLGIAMQGEAKAYSISVLRVREMVNDQLAGIPVLVTW